MERETGIEPAALCLGSNKPENSATMTRRILGFRH